MAIKTWNTTYREVLGRLSVIRNGVGGANPLSQRKLPAGGLLALRRFTRVCDEHVKDFQEAQKDIVSAAQERGLDLGGEVPPDLAKQFEDLLSTGVEIQVSTVPVDVFMEDGNHLTLQDLEVLDPILEEE